jgi:hypothetical protein
VDQASGVTIVTMPAHGNSVIKLNGSESGVDGVTDCAVTISGNGASVKLAGIAFGVSSAYASSISTTINDEYAVMGNGARSKLPKKATKNKITVTSPVILVEPAFADVLRGQKSATTGQFDGPVPNMTTEPATLGAFRLTLKVKTSTAPIAGNEEG